jgi:hypothetical protein
MIFSGTLSALARIQFALFYALIQLFLPAFSLLAWENSGLLSDCQVAINPKAVTHDLYIITGGNIARSFTEVLLNPNKFTQICLISFNSFWIDWAPSSADLSVRSPQLL